ncbi:Mn2+ homeostasis protein [Gamsiella multidivaricata]|uniref:Mn2+ homeostasis protein n=1 Tax=Gamsiella multidivaricata TaxID=101098 RepID=UPI00221F1144|nr:Mn2+ homeostasis protein [Gamsiella multidivaricata]KAG0368018.1 hypothetical protein BGZ54_002828 [Gamsiella multidivaricata]KAI7830570.1 Mn2+ homeostasis protein [Gamsiella multidivaricata]
MSLPTQEQEHKQESPRASTQHASRSSRLGFGTGLGARLSLAIALGLAMASLAVASSGDRQPQYIECVKDCDKDICQSADVTSFTPEQLLEHQLDLPLRLTHWTCLDNCRYRCMQSITEGALLENLPVHQYHGKWPFYRLWGMQEPASVLFSILNGYMHVLAWPKLKRAIPQDYYMRPFYLGYAIIGMNTWLWSAVYHARDWPSTEKLDYFSAGTAITYGLFYTVIRITRMVQIRSQLMWAMVCLIPLLLHISYLGFVHFDYGYNMAAMATVGAIHNLFWIGWSIANWRERPYAWEPSVSGVLITAAMCLEILDFAPLWGILDAHSLWHAATIPLVPIWYRFLLKDTEWEVRNKKGVQRPSSHRD